MGLHDQTLTKVRKMKNLPFLNWLIFEERVVTSVLYFGFSCTKVRKMKNSPFLNWLIFEEMVVTSVT